MASFQQIVEFLKRKSGGPATAEAAMLPLPMPKMAMPPSTFDVGVSKSTFTPAGTLPPAPPTDPALDFRVKSVLPPPELDITKMLSLPEPQAPEVNALEPAPEPAAPLPGGLPKPPQPSLAADMAEAAIRTDDPKSGFDVGGAARTIGQALSGVADAMSARAGGKSNFMASSMASAKEAEEQAKLKDMDDPASSTSQAYQRLMAKYTGRKPEDYKAMSATKIAKAIPAIEKAYQLEAGAQEKASERALKERELSLKERELGLKANKTAGAKNIPGFRWNGQVEIDDTEAKKLREGVAEYQTFNRALNEYRNMIKNHGTTEVFDRAALAKMDALAKNLQLKVKNLAQLGVLSASDIPFIEKQIPAPGVFRTASGMQGALDATGQIMASAVRDRLSTSGYVPDPEMEKLLGPSGGGAAPASRPKTVRQGGYTYTLNEATGEYE